MSRKEMQRSNLEIRLTHPESNQETDVASELTLIDRTSNKHVAIIELTLRDYHNLMAGRVDSEREGASYLAKPSDLAKLRHTRLSISRPLPKLPHAPGLQDKIRDWAEQAARWMGSDEARVSTNSSGVTTVSVLLYVAPMDASDPERLEEYRERMTRQLKSLSLHALGVEEVNR